MRKRLVAMLLVVCIVVSLLPTAAFAKNETKEKPPIENPFSDVSERDWYYKNVMYAIENGLFNGTSDTAFSPQGTMTRGMYVTVMGRIAEIDAKDYKGNGNYSDVSENAYYAPYVLWATKKGIAGGVGNGKFDPNGLVTREQMAALTVRFFDAYHITYPKSNITTTPKDFDSVAAYAQDAVRKLWRCGLLAGDAAGNVNPNNHATRAEAATFCARTDECVEQWFVETGKKKEPTPNVEKPSGGGSGGGGGGGSSYTYHKLSFDSNGGSAVESITRREGGALSNLPIPYKENAIFQGWYYDAGCTQLVSEHDVLSKDLKLYGKWGDAAPLVEAETPHFASATDQGQNFTITIIGPDSMNADTVKSAITVKNLNSTEDKAWVEVTKNGTVFTVSGVNYLGENGAVQAGFEEGATYKLTLNNDSLKFEGFEQETRDFNFTIKKADVLNLSLNEDMSFIKFSHISNLKEDGETVKTISTPLTNVSGSGTNPADMVKGTFTYTKNAFQVGDTVTIYDGIDPRERKLDDTREGADGAIAYVEITAVNGTTYGYKTADSEKVLFTPDVLPISVAADTDGSTTNNSITVSKDTLDFSDDMYAQIDLDSQTTVDKGDFLSFYSGTMSEENTKEAGYGLITEVTAPTEQNGNYIIAYQTATLDEVLAAMDMYNTDPMSGEEMLEGVDREKLEQSVVQQATDSGFAEEAGQYLAALALETDSFTQVSEDFELRNYEILTQSGKALQPGEIQLMDKAKVETEVKVDAKLYTDLKNFDGYNVSGVGLVLTVTAEITIEPDDDNQIVITVTGEFTEELHLNINVDGGARWKWWAIFPYIAEYEVTANIDLFNYTGISVNASIVTKEKEDNKWTENKELQSITDELKKLVDQVKEGQKGEAETPSNDLVAKYKAMLETESDWVNLVEKEIFKKEKHIPPIYIIVVSIEVNFVVQANMNISLGCEFWYKNAKRYSYNVQVFAGKVTSDVIDFVEQQYEFTFYVMGTLGLRAGISAEFKISLFSEKFASVGFAAEAGAYIKLYGYFYYNLRYTDSMGKTSRYAGALYLEVGIYLEISFEAQAFAGTFSYNPTLYENEWPLWSAGMRENILDFAYEDTETPKLQMKKALKTTIVPVDLFEMYYLDLKTGDDVTKIYDDDVAHFTIEMTNKAFSYDRATNKLTVTPGEKDFELDGQMVVTWINAPMSWTSAPISRKIDLHWDNLNDGYAIVFRGNGGSSMPMIVNKFGATINKPADPVKKGYIFGGWYSDENLQTPYTIPATMPNQDLEIHAKWSPATDTPYKVEYLKEIFGSSQYELFETTQFTGTTDSKVNAETKSYEGFITPAAKEITIAPDGSSTLRYYYDRESYDLTFDPGDAEGEPMVTRLKYGATITPPTFNSKGYSFVAWDADVEKTMPTKNLTYTAQWKAADDTPFRVEYYVEQLNGKYTLQKLEHKTGETNSAIDLNTVFDTSYVVENGISYKNATVGGEVTTAPKITLDGKLIVKLNYQRESHNVTFKLDNGQADIVNTYKYQARITAPQAPVRNGYTFMGWNTALAETMGTSDLTYTAQWKANDTTAYKVEHYQKNANDDGYTLFETENLSGTTDTDVTANSKDYANFTINDEAEGYVNSGKVNADGSMILKLYYDREVFTIDYKVDGESYGTQQSYKHGQTVAYPANPTKTGYNFGGWLFGSNSFNAIMPAEHIQLDANWLAMDQYLYTVKYYKQGLNGAPDELVKTLTPSGPYDSQVTVTPEDTYEGFTAPVEQDVTIKDGLTVDFVYTRNSYELNWELNGGTATNPYTEAGQVAYETTIIAPTLEKTGYTYQWDKAIAPKMGTEAQSYTANWTPNSYIVKFECNGGEGVAMAEMTFTYDEGQNLVANTFTRTGYTFKGWATTAGAEAETYTDRTSVSNLTDIKDGSVTLYAVWEPVSYVISYELNGGTAGGENLASYTIESGNVTLSEPTKTGYSFEGWYTDQTFTPASKITGIAIAQGSTGDKLFYAKWTANPYTVTFHKNTGDGSSTTQLFTCDAAQNLTANTFTRDGYNFAGWNTKADGTGTAYADSQNVTNLATGGAVNLYAKWELETYTIAYVLNEGNNDHGNPASYTVGSEDITLKQATRGNGYSFIGWYDGNEETANKVTSIAKGSTGNKTLYARWGFAGTFNVSFKEATGGAATFEITREGGTSGQQTVFFRTVNGSAIGGTHFFHRGGVEASVTFADGETSKTLTVQEYGDTKAYNGLSSTQYSNIARSYEVQLHKIDGGGLLGETPRATRTMNLSPAYEVPGGTYEYTQIAVNSDNKEIKESIGSWQGTEYTGLSANVTNNGKYTAQVLDYLQNTATQMKVQLRNFGGADNGWRMIRHVLFNSGAVSPSYGASKNENIPLLPSGTKFALTYGISSDTNNTNNYCVVLPHPKGTISSHSGTSYPVSVVDEKAAVGQDLSKDYVLYDFGEACGISIAAYNEASADSSWWYKGGELWAAPYDVKEPTYKGVAPLAQGDYKAGEKVIISLVYDEIVASQNLTVSGANFSGNLTYKGGIGSNVLYFEGTLNKDCTGDNLTTGITPSGTVNDMAN